MTEKLAALRVGDRISFWGNEKPKCPHCGADFDIDKNEAWDLYSEDTHEIECSSCDLSYQVRSIAFWRFSTDEQEDA